MNSSHLRLGIHSVCKICLHQGNELPDEGRSAAKHNENPEESENNLFSMKCHGRLLVTSTLLR